VARDLVQLVRSSLTDTLGAAGTDGLWMSARLLHPPAGIVEIAAADGAGYAAAMLVDTLRTRLTRACRRPGRHRRQAHSDAPLTGRSTVTTRRRMTVV